MICKWGVKNFKSILDKELDLAPLTVFCGVNSGGKSAFLRSIAMLAQSVRTDDNEQITFNGDLVNLGSFDHIHCKKALKPEKDYCNIDINFTVSFNEKEIRIKIEYGYLKENKNHNEPHIISLQMEYKNKDTDENITYIKYFDIGDILYTEDQISKYEISDEEINRELEKIQKDVLDDSSAIEMMEKSPYHDHE